MITAAVPPTKPTKIPSPSSGPRAPTSAPITPPTSPPSTTPLSSSVPATIPLAVFGGREFIGVDRKFVVGHRAKGGGTLDDEARPAGRVRRHFPSPGRGSARRLLHPIEFFDFVTTL